MSESIVNVRAMGMRGTLAERGPVGYRAGMIWTVVGAVSGFLAVALGAFAAHGLHGRLAPDALATFETGVRYQLAHALAQVALGFGADRLRPADGRAARTLFSAGSVLFAGRLDALP